MVNWIQFAPPYISEFHSAADSSSVKVTFSTAPLLDVVHVFQEEAHHQPSGQIKLVMLISFIVKVANIIRSEKHVFHCIMKHVTVQDKTNHIVLGLNLR